MDNFAAHNTLDHLFRHEYSRLVAMLTNRYGAALLDLVEDAVQESLLKAGKVWSYQPMPDKPGAWLYRVANNKMIDFLRREKKWVDFDQGPASEGMSTEEYEIEEEVIQDEMLKMIFACCHPSMKPSEQLMLSLKLLCGLSVKEIARALLKSEEATKKAIQRAKQKFKNEVGELIMPRPDDITERMNAVLQVIYLLFNEGYKATEGEQLMKQELCDEAVRLAFLMLNEPQCNTNELNALISMMLFKAARFPARQDAQGNLLTLEHQDRSLYRKDYVKWAWHFLKRSSDFDHTTIYQLEAAIASYYTTAPTYADTNWKQILRLYDALVLHKPMPVVKMSRVVVLSKLEGPAKALAAMQEIEEDMKGNQSFQALKAELYAEMEDWSQARFHLSVAIRQADNRTERRFLEAKLDTWREKE